ncbi:hypothetical protein Poli38472_014341 [Pythium oligandrum]|uniref:Protein kinase domain-containing protein n=1 Tax=Pythium oligandrum TaxID=41045 RepID=A0A8K1C7A7_PYTOL|nr:hypothetical protein Poli38472_014341 [Pythium oligandrum]|eukprot:TMW57738.1 hypothetical protein Poli38472_014341 [Pythium oligandrum]
MNADLTDPQYSCPSDVTFTTDCKDDQGQFAYCIVQPEDNSCKLHSDCRPTAFPDVLCNSMRIARVDNIPANITSLNLGFNALREFNPTYTNGTSNLRVLSLAANYFEDMDDLTIPSSVQIMYVHIVVDGSNQGLTECLWTKDIESQLPQHTQVFPGILECHQASRVTQSDPGCESNTPGIADLEAKNIGLASLGDLQLPSTIMNLDVSANPNMTFDKFVAPADLRSFVAVQSEIKALSEIDFSPTQQLSAIILNGNNISSITGVNFPSGLQTLDLNGSDVSCFIVRESDVSTLTGLKNFAVTSISQDGCDRVAMNGTSRPSLTIAGDNYTFSVMDDETFASRYFPRKLEFTAAPLDASSAPSGPTVSSSTAAIVALVAVIALILSSVGIIIYRRRKNERLQYTDIKRSRVLAKGGFGIVYLATFNDREVVAKQILPEKAKDSHAISRFMDEIRLWAKLNHPNIVQFLVLLWTTLADVTVVTEYMSNGDLAVMLRSQAAVSRHRELFTWTKSAGQIKRNKLELAIDIAEALVYLHGQSPSIIHRDLKSQNVLLNESCVAKVTDFGISREVEDYMTAEIGTVAWIAPEILDGGQYTERADIYSFGVVLSELDTCEKPYASGIHTPTGEFIAKVPNAHIALAVSDGSLRPSFDNDCPRAIRAIAQRCLERNAEDRPTPFELLTELCALQGQL